MPRHVSRSGKEVIRVQGSLLSIGSSNVTITRGFIFQSWHGHHNPPCSFLPGQNLMIFRPIPCSGSGFTITDWKLLIVLMSVIAWDPENHKKLNHRRGTSDQVCLGFGPGMNMLPKYDPCIFSVREIEEPRVCTEEENKGCGHIADVLLPSIDCHARHHPTVDTVSLG